MIKIDEIEGTGNWMFFANIPDKGDAYEMKEQITVDFLILLGER